MANRLKNLMRGLQSHTKVQRFSTFNLLEIPRGYGERIVYSWTPTGDKIDDDAGVEFAG